MSMEKEKLQKKLQEKYLQIEMLNNEFEQVCSQGNVIGSRLNELVFFKDSVSKLTKGVGFSQLGSGIFVPSEIKEDNKFLVDVGKKLYVNMTKKELESFLEKRIDSFKSVMSEIDKRQKQLQKEIQSAYTEIQGLQSPSNK